MQTVLFIRFSSIGDIVLCSPLLRALKTQKPDTRILFVTKKQYRELLEHNPYIDKLFLFDKDIGLITKELKAEQIDFIADLHNNLRSRRLRWAIGAPSATVRKYNWEKWLLVQFKINKIPKNHIVDRYFGTLKPLGIDKDVEGLEFYNGISPQHRASLLQDKPTPYVVLVVGGTYYTKRIPIDKWIEIVQSLPYPAILVGGKNDKECASMICECTKAFSPINTCGQLSIAETAEIIRLSQFVITGDTGMMHIAAAYHKTILSIWGNTTLSLGFAPYLPAEKVDKSIVLENKDIKCRPCSKLGYNKCPKKHFKCMNDLDVQPAINIAIRKSLEVML